MRKKKLTSCWGKKKNFSIRTESSQEWYTPKYILDALGEFDTDPCSPLVRPFDTAKVHYTQADNGLCKPWVGRVWLNPPYDEVQTWMRAMAQHNNGIALTFNRLGTHWFDKIVMPYATGLLFLTGNQKFIPKNGVGSAAPAPSVLIAYDLPGKEMNCLTLARCGLPGNYVDRWLLRQGKSFDPLDTPNDRALRLLTEIMGDYK